MAVSFEFDPDKFKDPHTSGIESDKYFWLKTKSAFHLSDWVYVRIRSGEICGRVKVYQNEYTAQEKNYWATTPLGDFISLNQAKLAVERAVYRNQGNRV